ncbi:MAG: hypothetical protein A2498_08870 [Lentisphaerae bacterium RIFOXYC12_FULL_60_16]|nr:MAG: hypothetical protein A2498_08870 [Lentisphaerae bacterium RIFOXYC12_FULL_60_16]OGV81034.1 MAG: hypothetical protein A2340_07235 [Lentisphaerae bacterium RIFOXYB12_FULL_60_10]
MSDPTHQSANPLNRSTIGFLIGLGVFAIITLIRLAGWLEPLNLKWMDAAVRWTVHWGFSPSPENIAVVTIDQTSLEQVHQTMAQRWPWPRIFYARMIEYLHQQGVRAIVFDMLFTEPEIDRMDIAGETSDAALVDATHKAAMVHHAFMPLRQGLEPDAEKWTALHSTQPFPTNFPALFSGFSLPVFASMASPSADLIANARTVGSVFIQPDRDGIIRHSAPLGIQCNGAWFPSLPTAVAWDFLGRPDAARVDGSLQLGSIPCPLTSQGRFIIGWYGNRPGTHSPFAHFSAYSVLRSSAQLDAGLTPDIPPFSFLGKIVYVGSSAPGLSDLKATPLNSNTPGVDIQATMLANILCGHAVARTGTATGSALLLALCLLVGGGTAHNRRTWWHMIGILGVLIALLAFSVALLALRRIWFDPLPMVAGIGLTWVGVIFSNYLHERRQGLVVRGIFEHYLDRSVVQTLVADPRQVRLGGERRHATVLFSDVANFTSTSEQLNPEQVVHFMNLYLNAMTEIILAAGGFLDKFVGDEIVAIFGAPQSMPDHAARACQAVLRMQERLRELQPAFRDAGCRTEIFSRTGLSTGELIVGNMGSETRMNYTGMGDTMNLGARIEGVNKVYGTRVLVSGQTAQDAGPDFVWREVDAVRVKGRATPVSLFELVGGPAGVSTEILVRLHGYQAAFAQYRQRHWQEAIAMLEPLATAGDGPSINLLARCRTYVQTPPPADWDGSYTMVTK